MEDLYNVSDPYGTYQTAGEDKPYEILMRLKAWNNEIRSTISKVNESLGGLHEQQTQILQNIDSIELNVLDIVGTASGQQTQISQLLLQVGQITLNVASIDSRVGSAEGTLIVQANAIASRVQLKDFTGQTIASMIVQDPYSISLFAQYLNLTGYVTFNALSQAGQTTINGSNITTGQILANLIYGQVFVVGNGTSTTLEFYAVQNSHRITSYDAAGFRIESQANLSLQAGFSSQLTIYALSKLWAQNRLEVSGLGQFNNDVTVAGTVTATNFQKHNGQPLVDTLYLANMNYLSYNTMTSYISGLNLTTVSWVNSQLAAKESQIVAWANGKFVAK